MLLAVAFLLMLILAFGGLVLDLTRVLAEHRALQTRLDAAALSAVLELDGTARGVERARQHAREHTARCEFARQAAGPWEEFPIRVEEIRLVRVRGDTRIPLTLIRMVTHNDASHVWAIARAEQRLQTEFREGLFPYSPLAPDPHSPNHGLVRGAHHTLRWAEQPSLSMGNVCPGDADTKLLDLAIAGKEASAGFLDVSTPYNIRQAILWNAQNSIRRLGGVIAGVPGGRLQEVAALRERIGQDSDRYSRSYTEYETRGHGNGRRLIAAAIHAPAPGREILGVGAFFLLPMSEYDASGDRPFCAEYVGSYLQGAPHGGAGHTGYLTAELVR
jgi:hypothetical protein